MTVKSDKRNLFSMLAGHASLGPEVAPSTPPSFKGGPIQGEGARAQGGRGGWQHGGRGPHLGGGGEYLGYKLNHFNY